MQAIGLRFGIGGSAGVRALRLCVAPSLSFAFLHAAIWCRAFRGMCRAHGQNATHVLLLQRAKGAPRHVGLWQSVFTKNVDMWRDLRRMFCTAAGSACRVWLCLGVVVKRLAWGVAAQLCCGYYVAMDS